MKALSFILVSLFVITTAQSSYAHSSHSHSSKNEIKKEQAEEIARKEIQRLIESDKIDSTWGKANLVNTNKTSSHWLSTFKNTDAQDKNKSSLYVYVKLNGKDVKASFEK